MTESRSRSVAVVRRSVVVAPVIAMFLVAVSLAADATTTASSSPEAGLVPPGVDAVFSQVAVSSRAAAAAPGRSAHDHDDRSYLARASARLGGYRSATNAIPRPGQLADDVAEAVGGVAKPATSGTRQVITIPQGNRQIVIRIMEEGGGRSNYYRVSVAGKEALTVTGEASVDRALTLIPIGESSLDDILRLVNRLTGGGG